MLFVDFDLKPQIGFFSQVKQLLWLLNICLDFPVLKIVIDLLCHLLLIGVVCREINFKKNPRWEGDQRNLNENFFENIFLKWNLYGVNWRTIEKFRNLSRF